MSHRVPATYQFVKSEAEFAAFLEHIPTDASVVAIDTEADSMYHYKTSLCLLQLTFGDAHGDALGTWLIDPLAGLNLSVLFEKLSAVPLVLFHAADYDLRLLRQFFNWRPAKIFDTMLAGRVLGDRQFGLAALVQTHLHITLPKEFQRYNWSLRPLNLDVLNYAANDTIFTLRLFPILRDAMEQAGRLDWHEQFCRRELEDAWTGDLMPARDEDRCWRVKGWQTVSDSLGLAVLRSVWHWREGLAEQADRPPFKIMSNEAMIKIAHWAMQPAHERPVEMELPRNITGRNYQTLRAAVKEALALRPDQRPSKYIRKTMPMLEDVSEQMNFLRKQRDVWAEELGVEPGFAIPNSVLESVVRANPSSQEDLDRCEALMPWQRSVLGQRLLTGLSRCASVSEQNKSKKDSEK